MTEQILKGLAEEGQIHRMKEKIRVPYVHNQCFRGLVVSELLVATPHYYCRNFDSGKSLVLEPCHVQGYSWGIPCLTQFFLRSALCSRAHRIVSILHLSISVQHCHAYSGLRVKEASTCSRSEYVREAIFLK